MSELDICIVDYSTPIGVLETTLKTLQEALAVVAMPMFPRIYLIDNGDRSSELTALANRTLGPGLIEVISGHGNIGFGAANNIVIARCISKYLLLLNPDVELNRDCLLRGLASLDSEPDIVMGVPAVVDANNMPSYLCRNYPSVRVLWNRAVRWPQFGIDNQTYELGNKNWTVPREDFVVASGCFMLCRTEALRTVGGFDENFFLYFEDYDLTLRLRGVGRCLFMPQMQIRHHGGGVAGKGWRHRMLFLRSALRFFSKHGWRW